jgi:hypothetical protein
MVYVGADGTYHHCPGATGGPVGSKTDQLSGNCRFNKKPRYCKKHQMICPKHQNWTHMKQLPCKLCEEADRAEQRSVACPFQSLSNNGCRESKNEAKVAPLSEKRISDKSGGQSTKRRDHSAEERQKQRRDIVAQNLEIFEQENMPHDTVSSLQFDKRRERAAEIIEKNGWEHIREKLIEHGVGEKSLPAVSSPGSPSR